MHETMGREVEAGEPLDDERWEVLRVEAGRPRWGRELDEDRLILEAGMDDYVSKPIRADALHAAIDRVMRPRHEDDDGYGDGDAQVRFDKPRSGTYDVWSGTFGGGTANATLLITETP